MEQPSHVDYAALRQQYADQKREEQDQEEGDLIQVTLQLPEGASKELKVLPAMLAFSVHCVKNLDCCKCCVANIPLFSTACPTQTAGIQLVTKCFE